MPEEGKLQFYISQKIEFHVNNAVKKRKEFEETRHFPDSEVAQFIKFQKKFEFNILLRENFFQTAWKNYVID